MKPLKLTLLLLMLSIALPRLSAQDSNPLYIQYIDATTMLIDLPAAAKLTEKDNLLLTTPYGYNLRLQPHKIAKKRFVNPQFVADSLKASTIRVTCAPTTVSLTNPNNHGYSYLYDSNFNQKQFFDNTTPTISFDPSLQKPGFYWLSSSNALVGVDNSSKKK